MENKKRKLSKIRGLGLVVLLLLGLNLQAQEDAELAALLRLYKENYVAWISSDEIQELLLKDPALKAAIDSVSIMETEAFKASWRAVGDTPKLSVAEFTDLFSDRGIDASLDLIEGLLSDRNMRAGLDLFQKIQESDKTHRIINRFMPHLQRLQQDIERIGVEFGEGIRAGGGSE